MGACVNSGLAHAPDWTPHRVAVKAIDGAGGPATKTSGMASDPFEDVFADVKLVGTNVTVECMLWSELSGAFVSMSTPLTVTLTTSGMVKFNVGGNRFFLKCTGTFTQVDINCAGANPVAVQSA